MGKLYLIPTTLGETNIEKVIPSEIKNIVGSIRYFIVENTRTARRYLKKLDPDIVIDDLDFKELNEHTDHKGMELFLEPVTRGFDIGIISEAGCPGVADPGAEVVKIAHQKNITVCPLVGPSSILLSLMASGMNGQNFAFIGYIPVKPAERVKAIKEIEKRSWTERQTQIFIEAPYRNTKLLEDLLTSCTDQTRLCIAVDLTLETEFVKTKTIAMWRKSVPDINKRPAIFLLQKDF
jgi:16S rRNA (cytidine1402-2'-O)-methyltransferase